MANGYKFSLEKLLEIRQDKEEESKRLFTESKKEKIKTEEELNKMSEPVIDDEVMKKNIRSDSSEDMVYSQGTNTNN